MDEKDTAVVTQSGARKKGARKIWVALLLLLPTLLAFISFFMIYNNLYFSPSNIYDITLYGPDGNEIDSERNYLRNAEKEGLVSIFSPITENLNETTRIPSTVDTSRPFRAVVRYMNMVSEYEFYFSVENMVGYCSTGINSYKLGGSDTEKFLSSRFSESLYEISRPPIMYSISGEVILPEAVMWNYKTPDGYYNTTRNYDSVSEVLTYDMSGALGLSFDMEPTKCTVKVYEGNEEVFSGDSDEITYLSFEKGQALRLEVKADWDYSPGATFYGTVNYNFNATVSDRAEFHLTGDTFAVDSFCGIFCTNVKDPSKIVFTSEPAFPISPEFELSRENAVALLPIVPETEVGEYEVTLKYGATTQTFLLNIKRRVGGITLECSADKKVLEAAFSDKAQNEIAELRQFAAEKSRGEKLFCGKFLDYEDEEIGAIQYSLFGDMYINGEEGYFSEGHEYRFERTGGVGVGALGSGLVIKKGYNESLGNYVILSHGCGLATWYAHLSTVDVAEGDYVVKGEIVGKTGDTGLSSVENVMIYVTLDSAFMNPQYLCGKQFD